MSAAKIPARDRARAIWEIATLGAALGATQGTKTRARSFFLSIKKGWTSWTGWTVVVIYCGFLILALDRGWTGWTPSPVAVSCPALLNVRSPQVDN